MRALFKSLDQSPMQLIQSPKHCASSSDRLPVVKKNSGKGYNKLRRHNSDLVDMRNFMSEAERIDSDNESLKDNIAAFMMAKAAEQKSDGDKEKGMSKGL